jgi:hypothetical protein
VGLLFLGAGTLISWWRLQPSARRSVWAEDGALFHEQWQTMGFWHTLFHPYAGYLQFVPRIATAIAGEFDVARFAILMTFMSCLTVGLVTAVVFICSGYVTTSFVAQCLIAAATFTAAAAPEEVLGNMANVHWYMLVMVPWILLALPRRWWSIALLSALALTAALTEIQVLYFLPLLIFRWRERKTWWVYGALLVGLAAQAVATVASPRAARGFPLVPVRDVEWGYVTSVLGSVAIDAPDRIGQAVLSGHGWLLQLLVIPVVLVFGLVMWRGTWDERAAAFALAGGSLLVWCASVWRNSDPAFVGYDHLPDAVWIGFVPIRYSVPAAMMVSALLALGIGVLARLAPGGRLGAAVLAIIVATTMAVGLRTHYLGRANGPDWAAQVDAAKAECRAGAAVVTIAIEPQGWTARVFCDRVLGR